jgi:putative pyrroloquinoline-quinone binding quinoprotein
VYGWLAATLVLVLAAVLLWRSSDAAATSSTTARPSATPDAAPAARLAIGWSAGSGAAPRHVLVPGPHGVSLRDPMTGREAWHYTRSNAQLCDATAVDGVVVAVFRTAGRCDEAVGLRAGTGVRAWYRNVNFVRDVRLVSTDKIVLAVASSGVATLDPAGGSTRSRHAAADGCRLVGADVGSTGVVLLQRCTDDEELQVELLDGFTGSSTWTRAVDTAGAPARLAGVDALVDLVVGDQLQVLSPVDGTTLEQIPLPASGAAGSVTGELPQQAAAGDIALVWARGNVYALDPATGGLRWSVPATGLPAVGATVADAPTAVLVPEDGALVERVLTDGTELGRSTLAADLPPGGRTSVIGAAVIYATADRVLALH